MKIQIQEKLRGMGSSEVAEPHVQVDMGRGLQGEDKELISGCHLL